MAVGARPLVPSRLARRALSHNGSGRRPTTVIGGYIALTKPRIVELLLVTTVPTMVVAEGGLRPLMKRPGFQGRPPTGRTSWRQGGMS